MKSKQSIVDISKVIVKKPIMIREDKDQVSSREVVNYCIKKHMFIATTIIIEDNLTREKAEILYKELNDEELDNPYVYYEVHQNKDLLIEKKEYPLPLKQGKSKKKYSIVKILELIPPLFLLVVAVLSFLYLIYRVAIL